MLRTAKWSDISGEALFTQSSQEGVVQCLHQLDDLTAQHSIRVLRNEFHVGQNGIQQ